MSIVIQEKLSSQNLSGQNLSGHDLSDLNLSGQDLSGQNLSGQDLSSQKLSGQKLSSHHLGKLSQSVQESDLQRVQVSSPEMHGKASPFILLRKLGEDWQWYSSF